MVNKVLLISAFALGTFLSACGTTEPGDRPASALGDSPTLTGTIANLADGDFAYQTLELKVGKVDYSSGAIEAFAQAPVAPDGSFSIQLPGEAEMGPRLVDFSPGYYAGEGCDITVTPASFKISDGLNFALYTDGQLADDGVLLYTSDLNSNYVVYTYVDRDVTIKGTCGESTGFKYSVAMLKGWNSVVVDFAALEIRNEKPDSSYKWLLPFCTFGCSE